MSQRITPVMTAAFCALMAFAVTASAQKDMRTDVQPPVVSALEDRIPSDAIVLFDGTDMSQWADNEWIVENGVATVHGGGAVTRQEFGDIQLHLEFRTPEDVDPSKTGQARGNSGVYLQGMYELQILDSYQNETYNNGMLGAIYQQYRPEVNAARPPGVWQTYDIIFRAPRFDGDGMLIQNANITVLLNGVLIQDHIYIIATPGGPTSDKYYSPRGPLYIQDHGNPIQFRNIWVRELPMK